MWKFGRGHPTPEHVRAATVRLLEQRLPVAQIANLVGLAELTVYRIAYRAGVRTKPRKRPRPQLNPLYDPYRDGMVELDLTGQLLGDPQPGRRALIANANRQAINYDYLTRYRIED